MPLLRALLFVHLCTPFALAQEAPRVAADTRPVAKSLRVGPAFDAAFRQKLDKQISVEWTDVTLLDAIERLSDMGDLPIVIDDVALEEEGVPRDEPITHRAKKIPLHSVLSRVLEPLNLTYLCRAETMVVTSFVVAEELGNLVSVTYDIRELSKSLTPQPDPAAVLKSERAYPFDSAARQRMGFCGGTVSGCLYVPEPVGQEALWDAIIRQTGPPEAWADQGGPGDVAVVRGLAFVRQTQQVQREIDHILAELSAMVGSEPDGRVVRLFETPNERRIRATLDEKIDVRFVDEPLVDVLAKLADTVDVDLRYDRIALEEEGVPLDEPVNLVLGDKTLRTVLQHVLNRLNLTAIVRHESLVVTSTVVAEELGNLQIALFDVRGLVGDDPDQLIDAIVRLDGPPESWADQGGAGDIAILAGRFLLVRQTQAILDEIETMVDVLRARPPLPRKRDVPKDDERLMLDYTVVEHDVDEVVDLIETMVVPESGPGDTRIVIRKVGRQLFVRTTYANHRRIHALLSKLNPYSSFNAGLLPGNVGASGFGD